MDNGTVLERDKFERENITGTIYEKYFDGEDIERSEIVKRILEGYEKVKKYDLENIFLLGVSQNKTEYMLPLIEKIAIENVKENDYEFHDISQFMNWEEGHYGRAHQLQSNIVYCGLNILGMNDILGVIDNFEYKEYEKVTEKEQKKFIELIEIFENTKIKNYLYAQDDLRESKFFSIEERIEYTKEDIENEIKDNSELKAVLKNYDKGTLAKYISIFISTDDKRTCNILNGLWILGIIRTKDNINGFNYSKTTRIGITPLRWFASEKYIIDYETIKKYFGKYDLIREFCDSRETEELRED